ncbi:MAG: type I restriction enzyme HsdR N-terminal domain-containing protein [Rhodothermia bacterium]|nr:type I restriction enzyme HsdR N-terminal domain-containing protein [Rhodothermia bacterium]
MRDGKEFVRDPVRRTFVRLTPEEWVRQYALAFLIDTVQAPIGLIAVEKGFTYNGMRRRADIVVFDRSANPLIIVECKSPETPITQDVFDQVSRYNTELRAPYVIVTNGSVHYCFRVDFNERSYRFLTDLPKYGQLQ